MTVRERCAAVLEGRMPTDRLPMVEWAPWWTKTASRWEAEGMPSFSAWHESLAYFALDPLEMITAAPAVPRARQHGGVVIESAADYEALRPALYAEEHLHAVREAAREVKARHSRGESAVRVWLDGFFWFPRKLFGIEPHLYAFYDEPELMHRMNEDLAAFDLRVLDAVFSELTPEFVGFAEDMSYNLGPMLSREQFRQFLLPYYRRVIPAIRAAGSHVLVDSDGDITSMVPWFQEAGIEGVYPLERQAGVDVVRLRAEYPSFILLGGYDKMVMRLGAEAMRAEFERILPAMRSGRYIPSVDHQTPPEVSLAQYREYLRLFREYCERAVAPA